MVVYFSTSSSCAGAGRYIEPGRWFCQVRQRGKSHPGVKSMCKRLMMVMNHGNESCSGKQECITWMKNIETVILSMKRVKGLTV